MFDKKNISDLLQPLNKVVGMPAKTLEHLKSIGATKAFQTGTEAYFFLKVVDGRPLTYFSPSGQCGDTELIDDGD